MNRTLTGVSMPSSAMELVESLPPEMKSDVFCELLRELIRHQGDTGVIPVTTMAGEFLATVIPAAVEKQRYEAFLAELPAEARTQLRRPLPAEDDPTAVLTDADLEANRLAAYAESRG